MKQKCRILTTLNPLLSLPLFSVADAAKLGISRQTLANYTRKGILERLAPGKYRFATHDLLVDFEWEGLVQAAFTVPNGVICLISALCYYRLTDQVMRECWIAIPHHQRVPKRSNTRIIRMRNLSLGLTTISIGEYSVRIFDRERCIIDAFNNLDEEIAIKALKLYLQGKWHKPDLKKLELYAKKLRVNLKPYILAYTI
jgi:predicted transcriptional regulator of viral defense system